MPVTVAHPKGDFTFLSTCEDLGTPLAIKRMCWGAVQINRATFLRYVDVESLRRVENILGYDSHPSKGLTMSGDKLVSYFKGRLNRRSCVYFVWGELRFIFAGPKTEA